MSAITTCLEKQSGRKNANHFFQSSRYLQAQLSWGLHFLQKKSFILREYPVNYALMFFTGSLALLTASLGFWNIRETLPSQLKISYKDFFPVLKKELVNNRQLKYFLGFINTQGIAISFLPFAVLYSREIFNTKTSDTGSFLLFKVLGIVTVSIMVLLGSKENQIQAASLREFPSYNFHDCYSPFSQQSLNTEIPLFYGRNYLFSLCNNHERCSS